MEHPENIQQHSMNRSIDKQQASRHIPRLLDIAGLQQILRTITHRVASIGSATELLLIFIWTLIVAAPYANLNSRIGPVGIEFYALIQSNLFWDRLAACGTCALWNGTMRGGAPTFVDVHSSFLHPLVAGTTILLGTINGAKVALLIGFYLAGVGQWWLARMLGLGRPARLWGACMAVGAGFLAAQMGQGLFSMVISTVTCQLALPALLWLTRSGSRRAAVCLGVLLALALLAGQGYIQVGLALLLLPTALLLPRAPGVSGGTILKRLALAGALALLLAAPLLVPVAHFLPELGKSSDARFENAQPLTYVLFNLVISDHDIYKAGALNKEPFAFLYANFIGWIPLLLAGYGLASAPSPEARRVRLVLGLFALGALWLSSAALFRWLVQLNLLQALTNFLIGLRNCSLLAGLAITPILGLAACGLDRLLRQYRFQVQLSLTSGDAPPQRQIGFDWRWLLLIPLAFALLQLKQYGEGWIATTPRPSEPEQGLALLKTTDVQWVSSIIGNGALDYAALEQGLKLSFGPRAWDWRERPLPPPVLTLSAEASIPNMELRQQIGDARLFADPSAARYATLKTEGGQTVVCAAQGRDGTLDVRCDSPEAGVLTLAENNWDGWAAQIDGQPTALLPDPQLAARVPAGRHLISFRYRPWDVPLGLGLSLAGMALALYSLRRRETFST